MVTELILLIFGFLGLIIGTYTDIKIREIPDFVSFSLIFFGVLVRLVHSILTQDWWFFIYGILGLIIGLVIGIIMNYTGQWGGGDSKLIMGLFCIFATTPVFCFGKLFFDFEFSFLTIFFFNIFFVGAIYSLIYSAVKVIVNWKEFKIIWNEHFKKSKKMLSIICVSCAFVFLVSFLFEMYLKVIIISISILIPVFFFLILYIQSVEKSCFILKYPIEKLREGDWIQDKLIINKKVIYEPKEFGISKEQIEKLKKSKIKSVTVKEGIPFVPAFLIAFLITYFIGNWLFLFLI